LGGENGRIVLPFIDVIESERERLKPFRRALNKKDQESFDHPFDRAKNAYQCRGLHVPFLADGNHPPVHPSGAREDDRGDSRLAQRERGVAVAGIQRMVAFRVSRPRGRLLPEVIKSMIHISTPDFK